MSNKSKSFVERAILSRPCGWDYTERSKLGLDHFQFEEIDPFYWHGLGVSNPYLGYYTAGIYLVTIFILQRWMKNRKAFSLEKFSIFWNTSLGIFSIFGFYRTFPGWWAVITQPGGFWDSMCVRKGADAQMIFWVVTWAISKFVACGDTILLVLRKRDVKFVHVVHHLFVQTLSWNGATYGEPLGRWVMVWNFGEHALMYPYFAVRAIGIKTPNFIPNLITTIQLGIISVLSGLTILTTYFNLAGYDCYRHPEGIKLFLWLGTTFFLIFVKLFYDLILMKGRERQERIRMENEKSKVS